MAERDQLDRYDSGLDAADGEQVCEVGRVARENNVARLDEKREVGIGDVVAASSTE